MGSVNRVKLLNSGRSVSVGYGGCSGTGAVFAVTRLLPFFHLEASFTSADSWEEDERDGLKSGRGKGVWLGREALESEGSERTGLQKNKNVLRQLGCWI